MTSSRKRFVRKATTASKWGQPSFFRDSIEQSIAITLSFIALFDIVLCFRHWRSTVVRVANSNANSVSHRRNKPSVTQPPQEEPPRQTVQRVAIQTITKSENAPNVQRIYRFPNTTRVSGTRAKANPDVDLASTRPLPKSKPIKRKARSKGLPQHGKRLPRPKPLATTLKQFSQPNRSWPHSKPRRLLG